MEALAELFSLHRDRLWRIVNFRLDSRLLGRINPDDVLQESYLAASQRIEHYAGMSYSPFVWLRMIVSQTVAEVHRRHLTAQIRDADREVSLDKPYDRHATSQSLIFHLTGHLTSPSQAAIRAEMVDEVQRAIETMDAVDQEVLALRHFEELTNHEVAEVLDIDKTAASNRYIRAIERLKEILSEIPGYTEQE